MLEDALRAYRCIPQLAQLPISYGNRPNESMSPNEKVLSEEDTEAFIWTDIVITEKMDGMGVCITKDNAYFKGNPLETADNHHVQWINALRGRYLPRLQKALFTDTQLFCEMCFNKKNIQYKGLKDFLMCIGIMENSGVWWPWVDARDYADILGLSMVPELYYGSVKTIPHLERLCQHLMYSRPFFGDKKEGLVIRTADTFSHSEITENMTKFVPYWYISQNREWKNRPLMYNAMEISVI
jgi:hypothetical protein